MPSAPTKTQAAARKARSRAESQSEHVSRIILGDARWPEPRVLSASDSMDEWSELLRIIPGYDPFRDADGYTFHRDKAVAAVRFFHDELSHAKGQKAKRPFYLERWQQAVICNMFGWSDSRGKRRYTTVFLYIPRKNGKTPLAAGIINTIMYCFGEYGGEYYAVAHDYKQASKVWQHAAMMVRHNPKLMERTKKIYAGQEKRIQLDEEDGYAIFEPKPYGPDAAQGDNLLAAVIDEVHTHPDNEMIEAIMGSTVAEREERPLVVMITTSDYERPGSPCNEWHDYAKDVRDGIRPDPEFLPVIYEAARDDDWSDEDVWEKANPNLDVSVSRQELRKMAEQAKSQPSRVNHFRRFHLNVRTAQAVQWIGGDVWDACDGEPLSLEDFSGSRVWAGLDLATTRDMTALVLARETDDEVVELLPIFWIPEETARQRSKEDKAPYLDWISQGWIRTTTGNVTDYNAVRRDIVSIVTEHGIEIAEIGVDPWNATQLAKQLEEDGCEMVMHGQGFRDMAWPCKRLEELVLSGKLRHGGNPVLRWHASNCAVEQDAAGNMKPSRKASKEKIDGIVAAIMAVGRLFAGAASNTLEEFGVLSFDPNPEDD